MADVAHDRAREVARAGDRRQVAFHQRHAGAFHRDVRTRTHGDADFSGGERGGIVHAVARHRDLTAFSAQLFDKGALLIGKHIGHDLVDAELARDRVSRRFVVAGQHHDAHPFCFQARDRAWRRRFDRVGNGDDAGGRTVNRDVHDRRPFGAQTIGGGVERRCRDVQTGEELCVADRDLAAVDRADDTLAGDRFERGDGGKRRALPFGGAHDCGGQRVFTRTLQGGGQTEQVELCDRIEGFDGDDFRFALGQRARLVDNERVDFLEAFQRFGVFDQHARLGAATDAHHDRHRRRETQCARAGDDQHGDRRDQTVTEARLRAPNAPGEECDHSDGDHRRHEPAGDLIGEALDRRAAALGLCDHGDDLREHRLGADLLGFHDERSGLVDRPTDQLVTRRLGDGDGFARDHRLVDIATSLDQRAVDRDALARAHAQTIAFGHVFKRDLFVGSAGANTVRDLRREVQQRADRAAGVFARA